MAKAARVILVEQDYSFLAIDKGEDHSLEPGLRAVLNRGETYLGMVEVISVRPSTSGCNILLGDLVEGVTIQEGDTVFFPPGINGKVEAKPAFESREAKPEKGFVELSPSLTRKRDMLIRGAPSDAVTPAASGPAVALSLQTEISGLQELLERANRGVDEMQQQMDEHRRTLKTLEQEMSAFRRGGMGGHHWWGYGTVVDVRADHGFFVMRGDRLWPGLEVAIRRDEETIGKARLAKADGSWYNSQIGIGIIEPGSIAEGKAVQEGDRVIAIHHLRGYESE